jgi:hypothetical protein
MIIVVARGSRDFLIQQVDLRPKVGLYTYPTLILFYQNIILIAPDLYQTKLKSLPSKDIIKLKCPKKNQDNNTFLSSE